jgi:hypothetical protein
MKKDQDYRRDLIKMHMYVVGSYRYKFHIKSDYKAHYIFMNKDKACRFCLLKNERARKRIYEVKKVEVYDYTLKVFTY